MNPLEETRKKDETAEATKRAGLHSLSPKENKVISFFDKDATGLEWEDWQWQLRHCIRDREILEKIVDLTPQERAGIDQCRGKLAMSITPYFASLIDPKDPQCPIRRQCVPLVDELHKSDDEMEDPCGEEKDSPVHGLVHRYPDRVLFLVSEMCATYCRYCTRSRMVGDGTKTLNQETYEAAFDYIRSHKEIRDVLISGGDPLMLSHKMLDYILKSIKAIPHVEFVRMGTRVPVTLPQRITSDLIGVLKKYRPLWMSIHVSHPKEITRRVKFACDALADSGIPLGSQTVLLKGINDDPETMARLVHELLKVRIRPYYLYQCDPINGSKHFHVSVQKGIDIMRKLQGHTSGYAVPSYVLDAPGGGGKIPINPQYIVSHQDGFYTLRNYAGQTFRYQDPE